MVFESNIQEVVVFAFSQERMIPVVSWFEQDEMEATCELADAEFFSHGCCIKASKALYCSGENRTNSWCS